eukprot:scaffold11178_cov23-Tisochrysis_lutea.AAC.1
MKSRTLVWTVKGNWPLIPALLQVAIKTEQVGVLFIKDMVRLEGLLEESGAIDGASFLAAWKALPAEKQQRLTGLLVQFPEECVECMLAGLATEQKYKGSVHKLVEFGPWTRWMPLPPSCPGFWLGPGSRSSSECLTSAWSGLYVSTCAASTALPAAFVSGPCISFRSCLQMLLQDLEWAKAKLHAANLFVLAHRP